jgi:hypothetical protein
MEEVKVNEEARQLLNWMSAHCHDIILAGQFSGKDCDRAANMLQVLEKVFNQTKDGSTQRK